MGLTDKHLAYGDDIPQTQVEKDYYWALKDFKEKQQVSKKDTDMTIQEAIKYFKNCNDRIISAAIDENADSKFMKETIDANNMAIRSLEAWEKVKKDVMKLEGLCYSSGIRVYQDEVIDIIDKHLKEVEKMMVL